EAKQKGLLTEDGNFRDPTTGEVMPLEMAVTRGLIDGQLFTKQLHRRTVRSSSPGRTLDLPEVPRVTEPAEKYKVSTPQMRADILDGAELRSGLSSEHSTPPTSLNDSLNEDDQNIIKLRHVTSASERRLPTSLPLKSAALDASLTDSLEGDEQPVPSESVEDVTTPSDKADNRGSSLSRSTSRSSQFSNLSTLTAIELRKPHEATIQPETLNSLITRGVLDPARGELRLPNGESLTLTEAIDRGLIDLERSRIKDPNTGRHVPLPEAIKSGLFDPNTCSIQPTGEEALSLEDALNEGLIPEHTPSAPDRMTFEEALERGLIDLRTNVFFDPRSKRQMSVQDAISEGILDSPQSHISIRRSEMAPEKSKDSRKSLQEAPLVEKVPYRDVPGRRHLLIQGDVEILQAFLGVIRLIDRFGAFRAVHEVADVGGDRSGAIHHAVDNGLHSLVDLLGILWRSFRGIRRDVNAGWRWRGR
ncbi:MAG: hypothetical protein AAFQ13_11890, partial [Pseudomonadota bacterium]